LHRFDQRIDRLNFTSVARHTATLSTISVGGSVMATFSFYLYGAQAAGTVARETPL
jgi:hypothetical protein